MIKQQSLEAMQHTRRRVQLPHFHGVVTDLISSPSESSLPSPQAFLVEQDPHWTLPTHFHQEHQFQLFIGGSASLGRHILPDLTVHYASPHSAYGPLISGQQGVSYLTLRAITDHGAWVLPERRKNLLTHIPKIQAHAAPSTHLDDEALRKLSQTEQEMLMDPRTGGTGAWILRLPAGASAPAPESMTSNAGRFHVLTRGQMCLRNHWSSALTIVWADADEPIDIRAGNQGAEIITLQFPLAASRSFVDDLALPKKPY